MGKDSIQHYEASVGGVYLVQSAVLHVKENSQGGKQPLILFSLQSHEMLKHGDEMSKLTHRHASFCRMLRHLGL
jgi:hypothetical protein